MSRTDPSKVIGHRFRDREVSYNRRDAILYSLGLGVHDLRYVYEQDADFSLFPTFPVVLGMKGTSSDVVPFGANTGFDELQGIEIDPTSILHGEQSLEVLRRPLPVEGRFRLSSKVTGLYDKRSGALMTTESVLHDIESGAPVVRMVSGVFLRGAGGFGGDRGPSNATQNEPPTREPDAVATERVCEHAAAVYRLSGDYNPLHIDPQMAAAVGYKKPILHGLCTFGRAVNAVLKQYGGNDPSKFKSVSVRFTNPVLPGETMQTLMWQSGNKIIFQVKVKETGKVAIGNAAVELTEVASQKKQAAPAASDNCKSAAIFEQMAAAIAQNPGAVKQVNAIYHFNITDKQRVFTVDLKNGAGAVLQGAQGKADCTISIADDDYVKMSTGELKPQEAFMKGKMKISGNMMLASKLSVLSKPPSKL